MSGASEREAATQGKSSGESQTASPKRQAGRIKTGIGATNRGAMLRTASQGSNALRSAVVTAQPGSFSAGQRRRPEARHMQSPSFGSTGESAFNAKLVHESLRILEKALGKGGKPDTVRISRSEALVCHRALLSTLDPKVEDVKQRAMALPDDVRDYLLFEYGEVPRFSSGGASSSGRMSSTRSMRSTESHGLFSVKSVSSNSKASSSSKDTMFQSFKSAPGGSGARGPLLRSPRSAVQLQSKDSLSPLPKSSDLEFLERVMPDDVALSDDNNDDNGQVASEEESSTSPSPTVKPQRLHVLGSYFSEPLSVRPLSAEGDDAAGGNGEADEVPSPRPEESVSRKKAAAAGTPASTPPSPSEVSGAAAPFLRSQSDISGYEATGESECEEAEAGQARRAFANSTATNYTEASEVFSDDDSFQALERAHKSLGAGVGARATSGRSLPAQPPLVNVDSMHCKDSQAENDSNGPKSPQGARAIFHLRSGSFTNRHPADALDRENRSGLSAACVGVFADCGLKGAMAGFNPESALAQALVHIDEWDSFDVFKVAEHATRGPMVALGIALFERHGFFDGVLRLSLEFSCKYLESLQARYHQNPYHNAIHGADVGQTMSHFLIRCGVGRYCTPLSRFAALFAALVHDVAHPGVTNAFLVKTWHPLAMRYNDKAPLEMMHASTSFEILREEGCNILSTLSDEDVAIFRKTVISMILATDNAEHDLVLGRVTKLAKALELASPTLRQTYSSSSLVSRDSTSSAPDALNLSSSAPLPNLGEDGDSGSPTCAFSGGAIMVSDLEQLYILEAALHAADISSSAKPWDLYQRWTERLCVEFRSQGDLEKERGLPVLPFMDRSIRLPISRFQAGFIQTIVFPLYDGLQQVVDLDFRHCLETLHSNLERWQSATKAESQAESAALDLASEVHLAVKVTQAKQTLLRWGSSGSGEKQPPHFDAGDDSSYGIPEAAIPAKFHRYHS